MAAQGHPRSLIFGHATSYWYTSDQYSNVQIDLALCRSARFWDSTTYLLKIANFPTISHLTPSMGVTPIEFLKTVKSANNRLLRSWRWRFHDLA